MYHILGTQIECQPVDNPWLPRQTCESMATTCMQVKSKIRMPWIQKSASGLREKKKYP
jgi:hypothetical protein